MFNRLLNWLLPKPTFKTLSQGEYGGMESLGYLLITKQEDLPEGLIETTPDFSKHHLVLLSLGIKSTGGYLIEATNVYRNGCTLNIQYITKGPQKGEMVTDALSTVYHLISIPKFKKIKIQDETR